MPQLAEAVGEMRASGHKWWSVRVEFLICQTVRVCTMCLHLMKMRAVIKWDPLAYCTAFCRLTGCFTYYVFFCLLLFLQRLSHSFPTGQTPSSLHPDPFLKRTGCPAPGSGSADRVPLSAPFRVCFSCRLPPRLRSHLSQGDPHLVTERGGGLKAEPFQPPARHSDGHCSRRAPSPLAEALLGLHHRRGSSSGQSCFPLLPSIRIDL